MDFEFIRTYAPMYVEAAKLTISIAFLEFYYLLFGDLFVVSFDIIRFRF